METKELTRLIYKQAASHKMWHKNKDNESGTWVIPMIQLRIVLDEILAQEKKGTSK